MAGRRSGDEIQPTTRSSRSRPTRSTSSCPRPPAAPSRAPRRGGRHGHRRPGHRADRRRLHEAAPTARPRAMAGDGRTSAATPSGPTGGGRRQERHRARAAPPRAARRRARLARGRARRRRGGRRPRARRRQRPGGTHRQGGRARRRRRQRRRGDGHWPGSTAAPEGAELMRGGAAALARYMEQSLLGPHRHELPHAHRHRARRPPARAQGGGAQGLLHPPDRVRDRPRRGRDAGDDRPLRRARRQAAPRPATARSISASRWTSRSRTAPAR